MRRPVLVPGHSTVGSGHQAKCSCGATPPKMLSTFSKQQWLREHKLTQLSPLLRGH